jgi:hypothetical protein
MCFSIAGECFDQSVSDTVLCSVWTQSRVSVDVTRYASIHLLCGSRDFVRIRVNTVIFPCAYFFVPSHPWFLSIQTASEPIVVSTLCPVRWFSEVNIENRVSREYLDFSQRTSWFRRAITWKNANSSDFILGKLLGPNHFVWPPCNHNVTNFLSHGRLCQLYLTIVSAFIIFWVHSWQPDTMRRKEWTFEKEFILIRILLRECCQLYYKWSFTMIGEVKSIIISPSPNPHQSIQDSDLLAIWWTWLKSDASLRVIRDSQISMSNQDSHTRS